MRILFYPLVALLFLTIKRKRRKKKRKGQRGSVHGSQGTGISLSTSDGNLLFLLQPESRFPPVISLAIKDSLVASSAGKNYRVATRATIPAILLRKFQFWQLFSCDFFTCCVASSRVATRAIFISRWRLNKI